MRRKSSRTRSPRGRSPSGRTSRWPCKDYLKGTCNNSFCEKWHPPECLFYKTKSGCRFGDKCSYAHRQVDEQPTKRSKKNDDKSAVAMLKKMICMEAYGNVTKVTRDRGRPDIKRDTCHELKQGPVERRSSNATTIGLCISRHDAAEVYSLRKSTDMQRPHPTYEIHESHCTSH